jgi:exosome complex RNA-binding protein Csl4
MIEVECPRGIDSIGKTVLPGTILFNINTDHLVPGQGVYILNNKVYSTILGKVHLDGKVLNVVAKTTLISPIAKIADNIVGRVIKISSNQVTIELISHNGIGIINSDKICSTPMTPGDAFAANDLVFATVIGISHQVLLTTIPIECGVIHTTCPQGTFVV